MGLETKTIAKSGKIRQADVMEAAAKQNFGPSKNAAFDDHLSSLRFARKKTG